MHWSARCIMSQILKQDIVFYFDSVARFKNLMVAFIFALSLSFCSCVNVWRGVIWKSKAEEKQTSGMRSRRKPVKLGDPGQLSQIHITKRGYKSSRGGVSVDPEKINPSLTIQGHQHGTHGGPVWVTTTSNKDKIYIHHSTSDTVHVTWRNTICPYRLFFHTNVNHKDRHTHIISIYWSPHFRHVSTGISGHEMPRFYYILLRCDLWEKAKLTFSCEWSTRECISILHALSTKLKTIQASHKNIPNRYIKTMGTPPAASINNLQHQLFIITYCCTYMLWVCRNMIGLCIHQSDSDQSHIGEINH